MPLVNNDPNTFKQFKGDHSKRVEKIRFNRVNNPKKAYKPKYNKCPPNIIYPEDSIRKTFFENHPFELTEPITLVQTEEDFIFDKENSSTKTFDDFQIDSKFTGESVVRYAKYLSENGENKKSRNEAYKIALKLFYQQKSNQEFKEFLEREKEGQIASSVLSNQEGKVVTDSVEQREDIILSKGKYTNMFLHNENLQLVLSNAFEADQSEKLEAQRSKSDQLNRFEVSSGPVSSLKEEVSDN
ncbi:hypothetical protein HK099_003790 [Clydaea vesicula]|uniref:Small ribosomal subunit protein mS23 n=1 Tax=Clydaea vesicula TaxID=447962 RepID=A0AAD5Y026_9FUNG|nr:hypothetical protein HK099_003790 [Clydaea vesicula]